MIKLIEASNFRSLKYISQPLGPFHVLIGANATGKTTFLDVVKFMADIVSSGIDKAVFDRVAYFDELTFAGKGGDIELAIEVELPKEVIDSFEDRTIDTIRYELLLGLMPETGEIAVKEEQILLIASKNNLDSGPVIKKQFPSGSNYQPIFNRYFDNNCWVTATKKNGMNANYTYEPTKNYGRSLDNRISFMFGVEHTALNNLQADKTKFPAGNFLKSYLQNSIDLFQLDSLHMRNPSAPGQSVKFKTDGSNLPWVIEDLRKDNKKFTQWVEHVQTALPDIEDIFTVVRDEDRKRYIKIKYKNGIEIPSWLVSDGTLRLLALTIPAYLRDLTGIFLIEEPENGIHPKAIESVYQSLSSVYSAQILLASHSTVILGLVEPDQLLCFGKTPDGVTDIVLGKDHPKLKDWQGNPNLNILFASGILS